MTQIKTTKKANVMKELERSLMCGENKSYRQYARELNIKKDTVSKYIQEIVNNTPRKSLKEVEFRLEMMYDRIISEAENMLNSAIDFEEREKSIKLLLVCHDKFIDFLERFGLKAKAIENYNIQGEVQHKVVQVNIPAEVQQYLEQ